MSHTVNPEREYRLLQQRLDRMPTGAPDSPLLMEILKKLFSPADAELARQVPGKPMSLNALARKVNIPAADLDARLTDLAERGLMLDFTYKDRRYFMLPPVVVGLFEFVFMRARDGMPMAELASLFEQYMDEEGRFAHSVFQKDTQIGRSLVHEEALPQDDHTEILDWERASRLIQDAKAVAVSLCACRHKAQHLGHVCDKPMEVCLTLNQAAETMARNQIARSITAAEGMRILEDCKAAGLAQTGDNVQRNVGYICNCCGCCCGMMKAIHHSGIDHAIVTSNWIMTVDNGACKGCGLCAKACPIHAIDMVPQETAPDAQQKPRKQAVCNTALCLGCGVCYTACKHAAIRMAPRERRVITPSTAVELAVTMAIERGKLSDLIFDDPENLSHRVLGTVIGVLEKSPPGRALMAVKPLRSAFLNMLVGKVKQFS